MRNRLSNQLRHCSQNFLKKRGDVPSQSRWSVKIEVDWVSSSSQHDDGVVVAKQIQGECMTTIETRIESAPAILPITESHSLEALANEIVADASCNSLGYVLRCDTGHDGE